MSEDVRSLLSMLLVIGVLLLVVRGAAPIRGEQKGGKRGPYRYRARKDLRILKQYDIENHLLGPLLVTLLLLSSALGGGQELLTLCIVMGACLGVLNRSKTFWRPILFVIAIAGLLVQSIQALYFIIQPHEAGLLVVTYKASFLLLVFTCFVIGAFFSLVWDRKFTVKALSFVVVLEILMLFAEPAFEVSLANPLVETVKWGLVACAVAGGLGLFSFPITLDLLAIGMLIALWASATGDDFFPVITGTLAGLLARAVVGRFTGA